MSTGATPLEQPTLVGATVELRPLLARHAPELLEAAADGELWNLSLTVVPGPSTIEPYMRRALELREAGTALPYVIVRRADGRIVGSTRLWKIDRENRKLEIGGTWLAASAQRTRINTEAKYLLLAFAFDGLGCVRVQLTTDERNDKSRAAILRLGAQQEGIIRNERIMPDGRKRNSVRFSIIDTEWPSVKAELERKLAR